MAHSAVASKVARVQAPLGPENIASSCPLLLLQPLRQRSSVTQRDLYWLYCPEHTKFVNFCAERLHKREKSRNF